MVFDAETETNIDAAWHAWHTTGQFAKVNFKFKCMYSKQRCRVRCSQGCVFLRGNTEASRISSFDQLESVPEHVCEAPLCTENEKHWDQGVASRVGNGANRDGVQNSLRGMGHEHGMSRFKMMILPTSKCWQQF